MRVLVSVVMGSISDLEVMQDAYNILDEFEIPYEKKVISAHRMPKETFDYASSALDNGIKVIIAAAGGAAHLPGVIAAITTLPVIGVPIKSKALNGIDSLLSIVQMPAGIPVATVGINASSNAALLAVSLLALNDSKLKEKLVNYRQSLNEKAKASGKSLNQ